MSQDEGTSWYLKTTIPNEYSIFSLQGIQGSGGVYVIYGTNIVYRTETTGNTTVVTDDIDAIEPWLVTSSDLINWRRIDFTLPNLSLPNNTFSNFITYFHRIESGFLISTNQQLYYAPALTLEFQEIPNPYRTFSTGFDGAVGNKDMFVIIRQLNRQYIAIGVYGSLYSSEDGVTWRQVADPEGYQEGEDLEFIGQMIVE